MTSTKILLTVSVAVVAICSVIVFLTASSFSRSHQDPFAQGPGQEQKDHDERSALAARGPPTGAGLPSMATLEDPFLSSSVIPPPPELVGMGKEFLTASLPGGIMAMLTPDGLFFFFVTGYFWSEPCSLPASLPSFTQSDAVLLSLCDVQADNLPVGSCDWLVFIHTTGYAPIRIPAGATTFDCTDIDVYPFRASSTSLENGPRGVLGMQKDRVSVLGSNRINYFEIQSDGTFSLYSQPSSFDLSSPSFFRCPDTIGVGVTSLTGVSTISMDPYFSFSPPGGANPFVQTIVVCSLSFSFPLLSFFPP